MAEEQSAPAKKILTTESEAPSSPANRTDKKTDKKTDTPRRKAPAPETTVTTSPPETKASPDNALHKRLGIRPGAAGLVVAPPEENDNPLAPLPDGFLTVAGVEGVEATAGPFDFIHVFARDRSELTTIIAAAQSKLAPGGSLWISWLKQSANRRGSAMAGDLNENIIRRVALTHGMVDARILALDRHWSAMKLVHRRH